VRGHNDRQDRAWDQAQFLEENARGERIWRVLMVERCRLRLCDNSDAGKLGLRGWQRRGGVIAPDTTSGSIVTVVIGLPVAALGLIMQRCLNVSKMNVVWASALAALVSHIDLL
jgi:hypothetical protein